MKTSRKFRLSNPRTQIIKLTSNLFLALSLIIMTFATQVQAQTPANIEKTGSFQIGGRFGYDLPLFNTPYNELQYDGGRYIGALADYHFPSNLGIRVEYANIKTQPNIMIADSVYYGTTSSPTLKKAIPLKRHFAGIGPSYQFSPGTSRVSILVSPLVGYSWITGGDAYVESPRPAPLTGTDAQLINTGFKSENLSAKLDLDLSFAITDNLRVDLGFYYLRHFAVNFDPVLDINPPGGTPAVYHGENVYDHTVNPYTMTNQSPWIISQKEEEPCCMGLASVGANIGLKYKFGPITRTACNTCGCPDDGHKVVVTVRDDLSKKVIPNADVAIKDMSGNVIATGTTNAFGVVDFGEIPHNNYVVNGIVYDIATTTASIYDAEFTPDAIIQKEVLYTDVRFILKGRTINKGTRAPEPNVIASLTNKRTGEVKQDNSDGEGKFSFRLDKNSSYEVVGIKENKLSNIEGVTTVGLSRSTTLFVDLELGVDDFECGTGTVVLDIKYPHDGDQIDAADKVELDRIVRYMKDHRVGRVELASHTSSLGTWSYNMDLSKRRAESAVRYIVSKGIPRERIVATGYGESQTLNGCDDGVPCSESQHAVNRRTEARLICN